MMVTVVNPATSGKGKYSFETKGSEETRAEWPMLRAIIKCWTGGFLINESQKTDQVRQRKGNHSITIIDCNFLKHIT